MGLVRMLAAVFLMIWDLRPHLNTQQCAAGCAAMAQRKAELLKLEMLERLARFRAGLAADLDTVGLTWPRARGAPAPAGKLPPRRSHSF